MDENERHAREVALTRANDLSAMPEVVVERAAVYLRFLLDQQTPADQPPN